MSTPGALPKSNQQHGDVFLVVRCRENKAIQGLLIRAHTGSTQADVRPAGRLICLLWFKVLILRTVYSRHLTALCLVYTRYQAFASSTPALYLLPLINVCCCASLAAAWRQRKTQEWTQRSSILARWKGLGKTQRNWLSRSFAHMHGLACQIE